MDLPNIPLIYNLTWLHFEAMSEQRKYTAIIDNFRNRRLITITVDYSCIDKIKQEDMTLVRNYEKKGIIELKATLIMDDEFNKANTNVQSKLREQYLGLKKFKPSRGAIFNGFMFNELRFNAPPTLRDDKNGEYYFNEFAKIMFPSGIKNENDFYDVWHLAIHYIFQRNLFLTRNIRHFNNPRFSEKYVDLIILTPLELVSLLSNYCGKYPLTSCN